MTMKKCSKCEINKELLEFHKNCARKDGVSVYCIECAKKVSKIYRNIEKETLRRNVWKEKNPNKSAEYAKNYRIKHQFREKFIKEEKKCYVCSEVKNINEFVKDKYSVDGFTYDCKNCRINKSKKYRQTPGGKEKIKIADRKRYRRNPLAHNVSRSIQLALKDNGSFKNNASVWKYLSYNAQQLKQYIEQCWESWMNWENYGKCSNNNRTWNLDHIYPHSLLPYDSMEHPNFKKCWALENLRPMEAKENTKKSNKVLVTTT